MSTNFVDDRYVINLSFDKLWHRVDEIKTGVYNVTTKCKLQFPYPSINVVFKHSSGIRAARRHQYPFDFCDSCS